MIYWFKFYEKFRNKQIKNHLLVWSVVLLIMFFLSGINNFASEAPRIAVYYFHNQTENDELQWLEEDFADSIGQVLSEIEEINHVSLSEVGKNVDLEQYKNMVQKKDEILFDKMANLLRVDFLFSGNYFLVEKDRIDLDLLMYSPSAGYLVEFRRMSDSLENLSDLKERIIKTILQEAGIETDRFSLENILETDKKDEIDEAVINKDSQQENNPALQNNPLALEYYKQAIDFKNKAILEYGGADYPSKPLWNKAIQNASKAVKEDPDFVEGYYLLYKIYQKTKWIIREMESLEQYVATIKRTNRQVDYRIFSESLTRLAHLKYNSGDTNSAINYLEDAISCNPNNVEARNYLMRIYYDTGQGEKALQQAEEIKRIQPDSIELDWFARRTERLSLYGREAFENYEKGYSSYIAKNYREAISYLEQAIRLAPAFKDAHYYLALSYYHYGKLELAIQHWEEALRLDPFDTNARIYLNKAIEEKEYGRDAVWSFNRGYKHYFAGEYEEALVEFRESTNKNPNFDKARTYLMRTYYHLGQMDQYLKEKEIIGKDDEYIGILDKEYYQLAYNFFSLGEYDSALEKLKKAIEINPDYSDARFLLAETLYQLQNYEEANLHYQYIIDNFTDSEYYDDSLLGSGWCYYLTEEYEQSENYLKKLVENFPHSSLYQEGMYKLGRVYFIQEKYRQTINIYEEMKRLDNMDYSFAEIDFVLGKSYFWLEEFSKAENIFLNIIGNYPNFNLIDETKYYYGFTLFKQERYQDSKLLLEDLVEDVNTNIQKEALYLLGRTLLELGDYDRVITINRSLMEEDVDNSILERVLFDLALSYSRKGEDEEAVLYFKRLINEYPFGELAKLSKIELAQSYYNLGQYKDSIKVLENIDSREALEIKIDSASKLSDNNLLALLYQKFKEKYPDEPVPIGGYFVLAKNQFNKGNYQEAINIFQDMLEIKLTDEMAREINYWTGLSFYRVREYMKAREYFEQIDYLSGDEIAIKSLYMLAETCYEEDNFSQAVKYYQEFLKHYHAHSLAEHVHYSLGWSYINNADYYNALLSFNNLIQEYPESDFLEESLFLTGKVQFLASNNDESRIKLVNFLKKYPDSEYAEEAIYIIAQIDLENEQWIDSIIYFEKLINEYPDSRYLQGSLYGLCLSYFKKDEYEKALTAGENYLNSFSNGTFECDILYITAICQEELGNQIEAMDIYKKVTSNCIDSIYAENAAKQLEYLNLNKK